MIDIKLIRTNPELVKENIKKKFQDEKLVLVDEVAQFDEEYRAAKTKADELRNKRKVMSKQIGGLMAKGQKDEAEKVKAEVSAIGAELDAMAEKEKDLEAKIRERMLIIPNIIDPSVPIGKDDSENVELKNSESLLFLIMRSHITLTLWKALTALILTVQEEHQETASIILWVTLQDFILQFFHMPEIS